MSVICPENRTREEEERHELQAVLQAGILKKAPNLQHFLKFVAEMYFAGSAEEIKEYSIAVNALNRPEHFDPQSDTIVRVTAHALRKKLEHYYATEGADHKVHITIPTGKYVLQFESKHQNQAAEPDKPLQDGVVEEKDALPLQAGRGAGHIWAGWFIVAAAGLLLFGIYFFRQKLPPSVAKLGNFVLGSEGNSGTAPGAVPQVGEDRAIRVRFGANSTPYIDVAGQPWSVDQYCKGGTTFAHPGHLIQGTDDQELFQQGREGKFQCRIPTPPGSYQIQLLFADTAGDKEAARQVDFSVNNAVPESLDVVDEGGGNDTVVGKVLAGIHPMSDGTVHLDFTSDGSFVNAVELMPADSDGGKPLRMLAGPATLRDDQGNTWLPERFFRGGRRTFQPDNLPSGENSRLFEWERYGHFHYLIPVVIGKEYRVKLYFSEGWFGKSNGGPGGIGSRVFDVYCNGTTLLKGFDILREQKNGAAVMTFDGVKPTAHGMLDLDFSPVTNYPLINAIEIDPES
jgi:hypothetical protein